MVTSGAKVVSISPLLTLVNYRAAGRYATRAA
jgi:hypothetical protein